MRLLLSLLFFATVAAVAYGCGSVTVEGIHLWADPYFDCKNVIDIANFHNSYVNNLHCRFCAYQ